MKTTWTKKLEKKYEKSWSKSLIKKVDNTFLFKKSEKKVEKKAEISGKIWWKLEIRETCAIGFANFSAKKLSKDSDLVEVYIEVFLLHPIKNSG